MDFKHEDNGKNGRFFLVLGHQSIAEMTYVWEGGNRIIIDHTIVDESLKGQGVGKKLLIALASFAREKKINVLPLCPFAKAMMGKDIQFNDLLV